jgi:hypothetical protein
MRASVRLSGVPSGTRSIHPSGSLGSVTQGSSCPAGSVRSEPRSSGETEGRVQVTCLDASRRSPRGGWLIRHRQGPVAGPFHLPEKKRPPAGGKEPGNRFRGERRHLARGAKPQESIGSSTSSGTSEGTDPRREQDLEAAGHPDLLVLRAGERDVRNGRKGTGAERRTALRGGKALKGEPHEWYRSSRSEGRGGSKPSGG